MSNSNVSQVGWAQRSPHLRVRTLVLVVLGVVVAFMFAATAPATAHDQLLSASPADGSISPKAPGELQLTFSQAPMPGTATIVAQTNTGVSVPLPKPTTNRGVVTVGWPSSQPAGTYRASWRVTSSDGHPINGTWTFTYGLSAAQSISEPVSVESTNSEGSGLWVALSAAIIVAILAGAAVLMMRLRRRSE